MTNMKSCMNLHAGCHIFWFRQSVIGDNQKTGKKKNICELKIRFLRFFVVVLCSLHTVMESQIKAASFGAT